MKSYLLGPRTLPLIGITLLLSTIGMVNLYSAARGTPYFTNQLRHVGFGLFGFIVSGWMLSGRVLNSYAYALYAAVVALLLAVLVLGDSAGGAQRWIRLAGVRFQPSEFAKIAIALVVAKYFHHHRQHRYRLREIWPVLVLIVFNFVIIFKQPDFGTAGICTLVAMGQIGFLQLQLSRRFVISAVFAGLAAAAVGWKFLLRGYQKQRIMTLFHPGSDPSGSGYNALQSLIAIGSGQASGKGFLQGTQTQLQFLPARHTDFIFSVFAEEHGFWGCVAVFALYGFLVLQALEIARESRDVFSSFTCIGIAALLTIEFILNVAMVLGMFPVVGMPLPFFSYGGSAMLTVYLGVGFLVAVDRANARYSAKRLPT